MIRTKIAAVAFGAALGMGGIAATAIPAMASSSSTEVQTTVPGGGTTTITLPGIGAITVTIDATTGSISNVSIVTVNGVTAAAPVVLPNGSVQIPVTLADGTQQTVQVSGEVENGVPAVETEVKAPESDGESHSDSSESDSESEHTTPPTTGSVPTSAVPAHRGDD